MIDHSSATASVSAGIAAANAHLPKPEPGLRFPGEDGGRSLAEMAHRDLDAALQLLAERAQYITGASGAAIALRRGQHNDMLCRASAGSNAPELGALLSMEYGLSGESARTRQTLRCDDAERDPRVNREGCRQLGIASVMVMPIVSDEQVLGVFELFSGQPNAFEERDISALRRLSEMVETAVKHAVASQNVPAVEQPGGAENQLSQDVDVIVAETVPVESPGIAGGPEPEPAPSSNDISPPELETAELEKTDLATTQPELIPKKPLFWSAAMQIRGSAGQADETAESITVPPVLRNLQKCQACGFPVSQGRTFCVECEDKQWRGQPLPQSAAGQKPPPETKEEARQEPLVIQTHEPATAELAISAPADVREDVPQERQVPTSDNSALFLSSALHSESWFAANKYILAALLVVALVIGAIAWLR